MTAKALAALAIMGFAMPAQGQSAPPTGERAGQPDAGHGGHRGAQVFLSPAGEPFRAPPGAPYPVAAWFAGADADHDGALTLSEFTADFDRFFVRLDADRDGVIDGFEVADYEANIAPELLSRMDRPPEDDGDEIHDGQGGMGPGGVDPEGGPRGGGQGGGRGGGHGGGGHGGRGGGDGASQFGAGRRGRATPEGAGSISLLNLPEPVSGADRDVDGKVTREEWTFAAKARFRLLDKNGDGRLTLAELPLTRVQRLAAEPAKGKGKDKERPKGGHGRHQRPPEM